MPPCRARRSSDVRRRPRLLGGQAGEAGLVLAQRAVADEPDEPDAEDRAGDALEHGEDRRVVLTGDREPVDRPAEDDRAEPGAEERADDARPEAIRDEDREVPEGEAHHRQGERAHQRGLPRLPRRFAAAELRFGLAAAPGSWRSGMTTSSGERSAAGSG